MKPSRLIWLLIALVAVAAGVFLFMNGARIMQTSARRSLMSGIHVGMTRSEVIAGKGQPFYVARSLEDMRTANYVPKPTRPVAKEALEYNSFVWRLYVYIGHDDRVAYLYLGRT